jgi:molybdenum cofactor cytidylyltransferase
MQVQTAYAEGRGDIIIPSYQMRRGHPMLIDRRYFTEILALGEGGTLRDVINAHADRIAYIPVEDDSILRDLDTPQEYNDARRLWGID